MILGNYLSKFIRAYYLGFDHPFKLRILSSCFSTFGIRLTVPYAQRGWITLNPNDGVEDGILRNGFYEPEVFESLVPFMTKDEIFWDIGANIGGVSLRAGLHPKVKEVHAFEPNPQVRKLLLKHVELNPKSPIKVHALALSNKDETRELQLPPSENSGVATLMLTSTAGTKTEKVECLKIDTLIRQRNLNKPTLIKMDVEGWELNVLEGAKELFSTAPPKAVVFETRYIENEKEHVSPAISRFFKEFGYSLKHIKRSYPGLEIAENFLASKA